MYKTIFIYQYTYRCIHRQFQYQNKMYQLHTHLQHIALSTTVFLKDLDCYEHNGTIIMSNHAVNITVYTCTPE